MHSTTLLEQIEALTEEYIDLCAHYESPETYLFPDVPLRMRKIQQLLNGPHGLWEQRRAEIAGDAELLAALQRRPPAERLVTA